MQCDAPDDTEQYTQRTIAIGNSKERTPLTQ